MLRLNSYRIHVSKRKSNQERNFTTQDAKTISKGDIFCFFLHNVCCVCMFVCTCGVEALIMPKFAQALLITPSFGPGDIATLVTARSSPTRVSRLRMGHG